MWLKIKVNIEVHFMHTHTHLKKQLIVLTHVEMPFSVGTNTKLKGNKNFMLLPVLNI